MTTTLLRNKGGYWRPTAEISAMFREGASAGEILELVPAKIIRKVRKAWGENPNPGKLVDLEDISRLTQKTTGASKSWLKRKGIKPKAHTGKYKVSWYSRDEVIKCAYDDISGEQETKLTPLFDSHIDFDLPRITDAKQVTQEAQANPTPENVWKMIYVLARLFSSQIEIEPWQDREDLRDEILVKLAEQYRRYDPEQPVTLWGFLYKFRWQVLHEARNENNRMRLLRENWAAKSDDEKMYLPSMD